jgi:hypothetical protein
MAGIGRIPGSTNKPKPIRAAWMRLADRNPDMWDALVDACAKRALAGDMQAMKEAFDRVDGKVAQAVVGDSEEDPITAVIIGVPRAGDPE